MYKKPNKILLTSAIFGICYAVFSFAGFLLGLVIGVSELDGTISIFTESFRAALVAFSFISGLVALGFFTGFFHVAKLAKQRFLKSASVAYLLVVLASTICGMIHWSLFVPVQGVPTPALYSIITIIAVGIVTVLLGAAQTTYYEKFRGLMLTAGILNIISGAFAATYFLSPLDMPLDMAATIIEVITLFKLANHYSNVE